MSSWVYGKAFSRIQSHLGANVLRARPLAKETTLGIGGPAAIFAQVNSQAELRTVLETGAEFSLPHFVIGRGSNLLISDKGFPGIVLRLGGDFGHVDFQNTEVVAGGGYSLPMLVQSAAKHSLSGLEFAIGIPGSIGGSLAVNAGAHGSCLAEKAKQVTVYTPDLHFRRLDHTAFDFGYRWSTLQNEGIVIEAVLSLEPGNLQEIKAKMEEYFNDRKRKQPLSIPSAGSVFKNPAQGPAAAWLIETAGCKGKRIRAAEVSKTHANFITNASGATANDFYELMRLVQISVLEKHGVVLEPEIRTVGEFGEPLLTEQEERLFERPKGDS